MPILRAKSLWSLAPSAALVPACVAACSSGEGPRGGLEEEVQQVSSADDKTDDCASGTDTLQVYARKCTAAMGGVELKEFDCDDKAATEPPGQGSTYGSEPSVTCDAPNVLNGECDPGSKFHVLHRNVNNDGIYIAAHCRKKGNGAGKFGDIAVIEYNQKTGATCFYQALGTLPGDVKAPSDGPAAYPWLSPKATADIHCVRCHDNGPFIRSPYLAQLGEVWPHARSTHDKNYLPGTLGADEGSWNSGLMPYSFVGLDFQHWEAYAVTSSKAGVCSSCHRMGIGKVASTFFPGNGTSREFGLQATADNGSTYHQISKKPHSNSSPIWMTPGSVTYSSQNFNYANAISDCANLFAAGQTLPEECNVARFARGDTCGPPVQVVVNGGIKADNPTWNQTWDVPLGCKGGPGCPPGFYYWTTLHGPFYQHSKSTIAITDPNDFFGTYVRIATEGNQWVIQGRVSANDVYDATKPGPGGPGGTVSGIPFSQIVSVPTPDSSWSTQASIADPDGLTPTTSTPVGTPANSQLAILSGFIGNVARESADPLMKHPGDFLRVAEGASSTLLGQTHDVKNPANGWFKGEAWEQIIPSWSPASYYVAKDVWSGSNASDDVQLVTATDAKKVICYLTGIRGDWSKTRPDGNGGTAQPYAEIYKGPAGELRLHAFPKSNEADGVSAYASCLRVK